MGAYLYALATQRAFGKVKLGLALFIIPGDGIILTHLKASLALKASYIAFFTAGYILDRLVAAQEHYICI